MRYFVASAWTEKDNRVVFAPPDLIRISWGKLLKYKAQQALGGASATSVAVGSMFGKPGEAAADPDPCSLHALICIFGQTLVLQISRGCGVYVVI